MIAFRCRGGEFLRRLFCGFCVGWGVGLVSCALTGVMTKKHYDCISVSQ